MNMNENNMSFRIKVDLSKYFDDARRFGRIYVDSTKIFKIWHLKHHIIEVYQIKEPFHLLLNACEYLPSSEDVRILKENELIVAIPGTGIQNGHESLDNHTTIEETRNSSIESQRACKLTQTLPILYKTARMSPSSCRMSTEEDATPSTDNSPLTKTLFYSMNENDESYNASQTKISDPNMTEDLDTPDKQMQQNKKKRIRIRKNKKPMSSPNDTNDIQDPKKPRIANSYSVSTSKHIRFSSRENDFPTGDLDALLALRTCSTPLTFVNNNSKKVTKTEESKNHCINNFKASINTVEAENSTDGNKTEDGTILKSKPQNNDVITFKVLKIGSDCSPQMSSPIMAKVLLSNGDDCLLEILQGKEEIKPTANKFSLPEDDDENLTSQSEGAISLNWKEFVGLKLISRQNDSSID